MKIEQFEDKGLSHYSYAILSECAREIVLIDPARDIRPYLDYAAKYEAKIVAVIETHPHADFVSGHLELHQVTGATIYCSKLVGAAYPHQPFDGAGVLEFGKIRLKALNTPGHSPDSICIELEHAGKDQAVFTGDTLFIGDCGRPDLRENTVGQRAKREELALNMYHSLRNQLMVLNDAVLVYPAHGAGTLCGKALRAANSSTVGAEKKSNWSLQSMSAQDFVKALLEDQPFIPKYFGYNVALNKEGAPALQKALDNLLLEKPDLLNSDLLIVDTRKEKAFKGGHLAGSVNIQDGTKFETWLGSIIAPEEAFYLVADSEAGLSRVIRKAASIGYEAFIAAAFVIEPGSESTKLLDVGQFEKDIDSYTIVDVRNAGEASGQPVFKGALQIPLPELRERLAEIPSHQPIVVHCAGGYRSAIGSSIIGNAMGPKADVFDLGEAVKHFIND